MKTRSTTLAFLCAASPLFASGPDVSPVALGRVYAHLAEPVAAWLPLDPTKPD